MASSLSSLHNLFENPLQDSFSSWAQLLPKPNPESSFDPFGDICHRVEPNNNKPPPTPPRPRLDKSSSWNGTVQHADEDAESIELFGLETHSDINKLPSINDGRQKKVVYTRSYSDSRSRYDGELFPPPITSIGRGGKPRVYFKSFRKDGRFVLREIKIPTQRILQSNREDGRLRMRVVEPFKEFDDKKEVEDPEKEEEIESCNNV